MRESTGVREYLMPPLPNTLYTRDTTCWIYGLLTDAEFEAQKSALLGR